MIEAKAEQKFNFAKQMADEYFGNMIKLEKEAVRDLAKEIDIDRNDKPDYEDDIESGEENIPPEIYEQIMRKFMDEHYHSFIDDTIPKLDGLTPREASNIPEMRTKLVSLMKKHINSNEAIARSKGKKPYDWNEELGILMLKSLTAVAPIPRQEDFGLDAICTLLRPVKNNFVYAKEIALLAQLSEKAQKGTGHHCAGNSNLLKLS